MSAVRMIARVVLTVVMGSAAGSCAHPSPEPQASSGERERAHVRSDIGAISPVVLVTLDGVRWQEIFEGADASPLRLPEPRRSPDELMPTLHSLLRDRGAILGGDARVAIRASGPNFVSLPGYTEILGGRPSLGCRDNDCGRVKTPTLLDDAAEAGLRVAAFASWERLDRAITARPGTFLVSAGRDAGDATPPFPGSGAYRPDARTASRALELLAREQPDVLFLGLGDPDEHAHHGSYEGYLRSLEQADAILAKLLAVLDAMGERGRRTNVFVTADHGRAHDFRSHGGFAPESARVWLVGAGPGVLARGLARSPQERHLADIAPTIAQVLGLVRPRDPLGGDVLGELVQASTTSL